MDKPTPLLYTNQNFDHLLGLPGFSDTLLKNHFTLYQGYITNTNKLLELQQSLIAPDLTLTPEFAELTRRLGWEWNGLRLHELYFGNLSKSPASPHGRLLHAIEQQFGSYQKWQQHLRSICSMRGIGWAILYLDNPTGKLLNCYINEHDTGHLASAQPLIVIDLFEHAYLTDYGLRKADYLNSLFAVLDFTRAQALFDGHQN